MKVLNARFNLKNFIGKLQTDSPRLLGLDYDGTLAPFKIDPAKAVPYRGVQEMLDKIMENPKNRVVIISGRWTKELLKLLDLRKKLEIWGSHGLERLSADGSYHMTGPEPAARHGLSRAAHWFSSARLSLRLEQKPGGLAVHWRGLRGKNIRRDIEKVKEHFQSLAGRSGLLLGEFDGGIELRVPGQDKGDAISRLMAETKPEAIVVYCGDDITDEDAFRAIKGKGTGILVRRNLRKTKADLWLKPPAELLQFLSVFK
jgi:trehalose 6-phosphate phosphatase